LIKETNAPHQNRHAPSAQHIKSSRILTPSVVAGASRVEWDRIKKASQCKAQSESKRRIVYCNLDRYINYEA